MQLTPLEYTVLSSLKRSLSLSFQRTGMVFSRDPAGYARAVERLTTTESYGPDSQLSPATTLVNDFVAQEKMKFIESLMEDVTPPPNRSHVPPSAELWVVVQMLKAEALLEYRPEYNDICITPAGLSALRQARK